MSRADTRGWGRGWPQNNSAKMRTVRAFRSGVALSVHREIAPIVEFVLNEVERRGYLYDHGPKDVNDDWGYANRPIAGTSIPSNHSWGLAVDLDAQEYPQGQRKRRPPQWVDDIWRKYGFQNGVYWANPDPMHYEFMGTPSDARFLVASLAGHSIENTPPPMPPSAPAPRPQEDEMKELVQDPGGAVWLVSGVWRTHVRSMAAVKALRTQGVPYRVASGAEWAVVVDSIAPAALEQIPR